MKSDFIQIENRKIGVGYPPYIVAELSANHNGDINTALKLIELAKQNGADAIKIQTYTADTLTMDSDKPDFKIEGGLWGGKTLYELYDWAHTPWEWHEALFKRARQLGITMFSSPFDATAVDFLETLDVPAYKIASFELVDLPLIARVAQTGKPMIMSSGMANAEEIEEAVNTAKQHGCKELVLLHCISGYPAPVEEYNLKTMQDLAEKFQLPVGLSDHTLSNITSITAVALGAVLIEKHFTLDRQGGGPDDSFSMEPKDLADLCDGAKNAWQALGHVNYQRGVSESKNAIFRRSLYVVKDMQAGEVFSAENVRSIRPGFGLAPKHYDSVLGKKSTRAIAAGSRLEWELVER
ncbi:Pseudaminic acid synthase [Thalassocella blandensis]|nr:Pseudaminic acid synthase [Thalassocella blandensis]